LYFDCCTSFPTKHKSFSKEDRHESNFFFNHQILLRQPTAQEVLEGARTKQLQTGGKTTKGHRPKQQTAIQRKAPLQYIEQHRN
jgi:hypothetical protein